MSTVVALNRECYFLHDEFGHFFTHVLAYEVKIRLFAFAHHHDLNLSFYFKNIFILQFVSLYFKVG